MLRELLAAASGHAGDLVLQKDTASPECRWALHGGIELPPAEAACAEELLQVGSLSAALVGAVPALRADGWLYSALIAEEVAAEVERLEDALADMYESVEAGAVDSLSVCAARLGARTWADTLAALWGLVAAVQQQPEAAVRIVEQHAAVHRLTTAAPALQSLLRRCTTAVLCHVADWVVWGVLPPVRGFFVVDSSVASERLSGRPRVDVHKSALPGSVTPALAQRIAAAGEQGRMIIGACGGGADAWCVPPDALRLHDNIAGGRLVREGGELDTLGLENAVHSTGELLGQRLWSVCRGELPLHQLLRCIGDYFLCLRGSLWRAYVSESSRHVGAFLAAALRPSTGYDLRQGVARLRAQLVDAFAAAHGPGGMPAHVRFQAGLPQTGSDDLKLLRQLDEARTATRLQPDHGSAFSALFFVLTSGTCLSTDAPWPLDEIFTRECFATLRKSHTNIILLLHVEAVLTDAWRQLAHTARLDRPDTTRRVWLPRAARTAERSAAGRQMLTPLLVTRARMQHFVSSLKFFILTDVLHVQFEALCADLLRPEARRSFAAAKSRTSSCLARMVDEAFLHLGEQNQHKLVLTHIQSSLRLCVRLWVVVQDCLGRVAVGADLEHALVRLGEHRPAVDELRKRFNDSVTALFSILRSNVQVARYRQLLDRLDFNYFYSRQARPPAVTLQPAAACGS